MDSGIWSPFVQILEGFLLYGGGIGICLGVAIASFASINSFARTVGWAVASTSAVGVLAGLLAGDIAGAFFSWVGI